MEPKQEGELIGQRVTTPEEFKTIMTQIENGEFYGGRMYDAEDQHLDADYLMCYILRSLGYSDGVSIFCRMNKWYA